MTEPSDADFLSGRLLIAMPGIGDPRFERAVVFLCAHDAEHEIGIAVNRPVDGLNLTSLFERIGVDPPLRRLADEAVLMGGPVERERGFVLHTDGGGDPSDAGQALPDGLVLSASTDILRAIANGTGPRQFLLALGYAGWGPGQLEGEIAQNAWLTCASSRALVFDADPGEHQWQDALKSMGIDPVSLSSVAGRA